MIRKIVILAIVFWLGGAVGYYKGTKERDEVWTRALESQGIGVEMIE